jgi:hypothetical protein
MALLNAFFGERTITGAAAAQNLSTIIRAAPGANQAPAYAGSGIGCALNFYADKDVYVGTDSAVTSTGGGAVLTAGTTFQDFATGNAGNVCDLTTWYIYAAADTTLTVMFRAK